MKKLKIKIDLDGVVCDFVYEILSLAGKLDMYNKVERYYFDPPDKEEEGEALTREEFNRYFDMFKRGNRFRWMKEIPGSTNAIRTLMKQDNIEIAYITDRDQIYSEDTEFWLAVRKIKAPIIFANGDKAKYINSDNTDIFIDDNLEHIKDVSQKIDGVIVYEQPWNKNCGLLYHYEYNWEGLFDYIKVQAGLLLSNHKGGETLIDEREKTHGDYPIQSDFAQKMKVLLRETPNWGKLTSPQKESLEMVIVKISRILHGDKDHLDSWLDIKGYSDLVIKEVRNNIEK